jgi:hypothetical protein
MHSRKLHLLLADPSLTDYQHVHPEPTKVAGEWSFVFTPKHGGIYRIFADFTPTATNRSLYSNVDLVVAGGQLSDVELAAAMQQARNQGAAHHSPSTIATYVERRLRMPARSATIRSDAYHVASKIHSLLIG